MDWTDRRERMRAIIKGGRCIYPGSVFDPISACIAEDLLKRATRQADHAARTKNFLNAKASGG